LNLSNWQKDGEELKERESCILCLNLTLAEMVQRKLRRTERLRVADHDMVVDSSSRGIGFSHRF
jgi:hypothetical protein